MGPASVAETRTAGDARPVDVRESGCVDGLHGGLSGEWRCVTPYLSRCLLGVLVSVVRPLCVSRRLREKK